MRYPSESDETKTWLILAASWAIGGLSAWILFVAAPWVWAESWQLYRSPSAITAVAFAVALVGIVLRLPILSDPPKTSSLADHLALLLGYIATINWLGVLLLHCQGFYELVPPLLVLTLAELWIHSEFLNSNCLDWYFGLLRQGGTSLRRGWTELRALDKPTKSTHVELESDTNSMDGEQRELTESQFSTNPDNFNRLDEVSNAASEELEQEHFEVERPDFRSQLTESVDESGHRTMFGEVVVEMKSKQTRTEIVVGFCPPFTRAPTIDFELEPYNSQEGVEEGVEDGLTAKELNCTPAGMRFEFRRDSAQSAAEAIFRWYAVQVELEDSIGGGKRPLSSPLP